MTKRVYFTGEKPESPMFKDVVYILDDIRAEPPIENMSEEGAEPELHWSAIIAEVLTYAEYMKRREKEFAETILELDEAIFELDAGGEA